MAASIRSLTSCPGNPRGHLHPASLFKFQEWPTRPLEHCLSTALLYSISVGSKIINQPLIITIKLLTLHSICRYELVSDLRLSWASMHSLSGDNIGVSPDRSEESISGRTKAVGGGGWGWHQGAESAETLMPCITWGPQPQWGKSPCSPGNSSTGEHACITQPYVVSKAATAAATVHTTSAPTCSGRWTENTGNVFDFIIWLFDRVDLIKTVSNVRPSLRTDIRTCTYVRTCIRTCVRPSIHSRKVSSISNFQWNLAFR